MLGSNCCHADDVDSTKKAQKRIGVAEGKFKVPDEFDAWDQEIEEMFDCIAEFAQSS